MDMPEIDKKTKQLVIQFELLISEYIATAQKYRKEIHDQKRVNANLLKKIETLRNREEINSNELYLVGKIELLERELGEKDKYIQSYALSNGIIK